MSANLFPSKKLTPQQVGLLSAAVPSPFGDALGLLADTAGYVQDPKSLTLGRGLLSLAALIPGVPRYVHGTLADNVGGIRRSGLLPSVGPNTMAAYGEYAQEFGDDALKALYLASDKDPARALAAIRNQVGEKIGKQASEVTPEDVEKYGALVVTRSKNGVMELLDDGISMKAGSRVFDDAPIGAEPGDFYAKQALSATGVLRGARLRAFYEKYLP